MLICRNESGGSCLDERAASDLAVLAGRGEDRTASGVPGADHSGFGRGAEQQGDGGPAGDAPGDGQQVARPVCPAGLGRGGRCAVQPPENGVVLSVDEKPHIQALERAQGWLKLPNGTALTGFNHEYKRHGTTTLFAALEVATGLVKAGHYRRRRRLEFLHFMNRLVAEHPGREMHVILDNLNTHKPKHDRWLSPHK